MLDFFLLCLQLKSGLRNVFGKVSMKNTLRQYTMDEYKQHNTLSSGRLNICNMAGLVSGSAFVVIVVVAVGDVGVIFLWVNPDAICISARMFVCLLFYNLFWCFCCCSARESWTSFPSIYTDVWPAIGFALLTQVCFCYCIKRLEMEPELRFRAAIWVGWPTDRPTELGAWVLFRDPCVVWGVQVCFCSSTPSVYINEITFKNCSYLFSVINVMKISFQVLFE